MLKKKWVRRTGNSLKCRKHFNVRWVSERNVNKKINFISYVDEEERESDNYSQKIKKIAVIKLWEKIKLF